MNTSAFRGLSLWGKLRFIIGHYHWHIFLAVLLMLIAGKWVWQDFIIEPPLLTVEMIDAREESSCSKAFQSFLESEGYQYTDSAVDLGKDFQYTDLMMQRQFDPSRLLFCIVNEGRTDLYFWDSSAVEEHLSRGGLADLRDILSPELLDRYRDRLIYCKPFIGDIYPCAVDISGNPWIAANNYYGDCRVGVAEKAVDKELAGRFLTYLLQ